MTATYNPSIVSTTDQVRLMIGDTDVTNAQLQDEEIAFLLTQNGDPLTCAVTAADTIAARYARQVDLQIGQVRQNLMQLQESYEGLADRLRRQLDRRGVAPFTGGISIAARDTAREDSDLIQPTFRRGMMQEPGTGEDNWSDDLPPILPGY